MHLHLYLHKVTPLTESHFTHWNILFSETVNELFQGKNARLAINRGISIAEIIQRKIIAKDSDEQKIY